MTERRATLSARIVPDRPGDGEPVPAALPRPIVDPEWLAARLGEPGLVVLDATVDLARPERDGDHRASTGRPAWALAHVPGAAHLDLLHDLADPGAGYHFAHPSAAQARGVLEGLGIDDASTVVLYDSADGFWSARAWWTLRALGVDALVLDGGLTAWRTAGEPVAAEGDPSAEATVERAAGSPGAGGAGGARSGGTLTLRDDPTLWATRSDVLDVVEGRRDATLVCALGADQFTAHAPTRYSRRGHIPTSLNLPARDLAGPDGSLRRGAELQRVVDATLPADGEIILYCGGGISASYAALGLVAAGREHVRIYDGSLEEWSADAGLPLVV